MSLISYHIADCHLTPPAWAGTSLPVLRPENKTAATDRGIGGCCWQADFTSKASRLK